VKKRLYRSEDNKTVCGILGGVGEYFDVDPTLIRLGFTFLMFITGLLPLVLAYFSAYFIIPAAPPDHPRNKSN
jgi:phage shock protein C